MEVEITLLHATSGGGKMAILVISRTSFGRRLGGSRGNTFLLRTGLGCGCLSTIIQKLMSGQQQPFTVIQRGPLISGRQRPSVVIGRPTRLVKRIPLLSGQQRLSTVLRRPSFIQREPLLTRRSASIHRRPLISGQQRLSTVIGRPTFFIHRRPLFSGQQRLSAIPR